MKGTSKGNIMPGPTNSDGSRSPHPVRRSLTKSTPVRGQSRGASLPPRMLMNHRGVPVGASSSGDNAPSAAMTDDQQTVVPAYPFVVAPPPSSLEVSSYDTSSGSPSSSRPSQGGAGGGPRGGRAAGAGGRSGRGTGAGRHEEEDRRSRRRQRSQTRLAPAHT